MATTKRIDLVAGLALCLLALVATRAGATLIAPHALFIDHRVRSAALFLHNPDDKPVEVDIELLYGYPRGDGEGGVRVFLEPDPAEGEPSCAGWVRVLPRRVILLPGQRQTVRLLAQPPAGLPDGEYWSRVVIRSQPASRDIEGVELEGHEGVKVGLTMATRTIISLNYRKGDLSTGVEPGELSASLEPHAVNVSMELSRRGEAAWLGRIDAVLLDEQGEEIQRWDQALAVYEDYRRELSFPLKRPVEPGSYMLSLTWSTARDDLPPEDVIAAPTVVRAVPLVLLSTASR